MAVTFDGLSDAELSAMADRAWRGAARAWQEYRATVRDADAPAAAVRMMADAATSEDEYWRSIDAVVRARRNAAAQAVVDARTASEHCAYCGAPYAHYEHSVDLYLCNVCDPWD